jgi:hypothetical protein
MKVELYSKELTKFQIQAFKKPVNFLELREGHVSFTGSPRRNPYDPSKVILVADPLSTNTFYYEFQMDDIAFVEELPSIAGMEGEAITVVRVWIKKESIGVRCVPFVVEDTRGSE